VPELDGKVIVIIGGTSGLGLSAARAVVAAGGRVVAVGREDEHRAAAEALIGPGGVVIGADAEDPAVASAAIARAVTDFGGFHGLYHVAGGSGRAIGDGPLHEISNEGWRQTLDLNLTSLFFSNRTAAQYFVERHAGGVVLNMSSVLAFSPSPQHFATHAYAAYDVRFNVVAPGLIETPMSRRAIADGAIRKYIVDKQPLGGGRIGKPDDLDAAVVYLLSDASRFVTGQVLAIDGGWSVSEGQSTT
jgi:NAD(P)-dependent dehydrogenase (short-subunit alcohol dehydrogenase family)